MALRPVNGRAVWARTPRSVMTDAHRPLTARLDERAGRLAQHGGVPVEQVGPPLPQLEQSRCRRGRSPRGRRSTT